MTNVLSEAHSAAAHFPRARIISGKQEFLSAVPLRQTTCNVPYVALRFGDCGRAENGERHADQQQVTCLHFHSLLKPNKIRVFIVQKSERFLASKNSC